MQLSVLAVNAQADALSKLLDDGWLRLYDGDKLLASLRFADPASPPSKEGVIKFAAFAPDKNASASGIPTSFRAVRSDGITVVLEGSVGIYGDDLIANGAQIQKGATISCGQLTHTIPR